MTPAVNYYVLDRQGSVAVTTDETGSMICRITYDAWGKTTSSGEMCTAPSREFLGQETLDAGAITNLINLNARIYDPILGRFLGADPVAGNPLLAQSLNLYSYGINSPLWLPDPSGMCFLGLCTIGDFFNDALSVIFPIRALTPIIRHNEWLGSLIVIGEGIVCGPLCAAAASAEITGFQSGKVGSAFKAFVLTFAESEAFATVDAGVGNLDLSPTLQVAATAVAKGAVGGLFSVANGGNFGSGFLAAGFSSFAASQIGGLTNVYAGTVVSAVAGGVGSILGGGKFENGAITGAFAYAAGSLLSDAGSETVDPDLLGKHIDLTVPSGTAGPDLEAKVMAAITDIDQANGLTTNQIDIFHGIDAIVVSDSLTRSYVDEPSGTFYLQAREVQNASISFLASDIGHDAFHIYEYEQGGFAYSRSLAGEVDAFKFQLSIGPAVGLSPYETNYLQGFVNNPSQYLPRMRQSPF